MDSGTLSARRSPSQSRSSHRMLYGLVTKGRACRRTKAARHLNNVLLSKQRNVFCLSSSVCLMVGLELMVTARGKSDIMKRWVGGQSVLVLHVECEHFKTYIIMVTVSAGLPCRPTF